MNNFPKIWLKSDSLVQFGLVYFSSVTYKKGPGSPGTFKKSPGTFGLLWSWDHGTTGPARSLGPVLSRPVLGPSRDIPGRDGPVAITNADPFFIYEAINPECGISLWLANPSLESFGESPKACWAIFSYFEVLSHICRVDLIAIGWRQNGMAFKE